MIEILSSVTPSFNIEQIKSQALWAAVQAVLLIKEHKVLTLARIVTLSLTLPWIVSPSLSERSTYDGTVPVL